MIFHKKEREKIELVARPVAAVPCCCQPLAAAVVSGALVAAFLAVVSTAMICKRHFWNKIKIITLCFVL